MFNYFLKKDGYSGVLHVLASMICTLAYVLVLGSGVFTVNIFVDHKIRINISKPVSSLFLLGFIYLTYVIHFSILKFSKKGENEDGSFKISRSDYSSSLQLFFLLIALFVFFSVLAKILTFLTI